MTRRAPREEQGGAVHAKETAPFKAGVPALGEHEKHIRMAFAVWSKYGIIGLWEGKKWP